jgi:tetratricopeptide (TPR) repeat protein/transcriptional regulator with XRE-family HTH domain
MMQPDDLDHLPFGAVLQYFRRAALQTQDDLARQVGYQPTLISMIERGQRFVKREVAEEFATTLGLLPEERAALLAAHTRTAATRAARKVVYERARSGEHGFATLLGPVIAREQEIKRLVAMLQQAFHGDGPWVALSGEPGIGKTRLALEVMAYAQSQGMLVALGHCYREQQSSAYSPWMEILQQVTRAIPAALREALPARWPLVLRLLPDMLHEHPPEVADGVVDQQVVFRQIADFVRTVALEQPLVILVDDLHWADEASLDMLRYLARYQQTVEQRHDVPRLFLMSTCRTAEIARHSTLRGVLHALEKEHLAERVWLSPLTESQTTDLLNAYLPEGTIAADASNRIYRIAEGVPFAAVEMLQGMRGRGDLALQDGTWQQVGVGEIELPANIQDEIRERVRRLQPRTQDILRDASVLGEVFATTTVRRMGDRSLAEVEDALVEAEQDSLVRDAGWEGYRFEHALVQRAIYMAIPTPHRRRMHRAAAEALAETSTRRGRAAELAWHFREGDDLPQALIYSLQAGDDAEATYAHKDAQRHYKMAENLARDLGDQGKVAAALECLADVYYHLGLYKEAYDNLVCATAIYRAQRNWDRLAWATCQMARCGDALGKVPETMGFTEALLDTLITMADKVETASGGESGDQASHHATLQARAERAVSILTTRTAARVFLCIEVRLLFLGRFEEVYPFSVAAIAHARRAEDLRMESLAYSFRASAQILQGQFDEALISYQAARRTAEECGDLEALSEALGNLLDIYHTRADLRAAQRSSIEMLEVNTKLGANLGFLHYLLSDNEYMIGNWQEARSHLGEAIRLSKQAEGIEEPLEQLALLRLDVVEGNVAVTALLSGEEVVAACQGRESRMAVYAVNIIAELAMVSGHADLAHARLRAALDDFRFNDASLCDALAWYAWAEWELGHTEGARIALGEARQQADKLHARIAYVTIWRVEAIFALADRRWDDAIQALDSLVALAREMPYPYAEAKALHTFGQLHRECGEADQARAHFEQALAILNHLGERFYAERIERDLATE